MSWIRGCAKNWSRLEGQERVKWDCIGDPKERELLLDLMSWAKGRGVEVDDSLPPPPVVLGATFPSASTSSPLPCLPLENPSTVHAFSTTPSPSVSNPPSSGDVREEGRVSQTGLPPGRIAGLEGSCNRESGQEESGTLTRMDQQFLAEALRSHRESIDKRMDGIVSMFRSLVPSEPLQRPRDIFPDDDSPGEEAMLSEETSSRSGRPHVLAF